MATIRHLENAPITEALIDFRVAPTNGLTFATLQGTLDAAKFGYYLKSPISEGTFGFSLTLDGPPQATAVASQVGLRLHSHDEKYVAQFSLTGFTLSRLPPYQEWQLLLQEAKRMWAVYTESLRPLRVTRASARFINNLQLPMRHGDSYQQYLNKFVDVPNETPQSVVSFFQRFHLVDENSKEMANVTIALDRTGDDMRAPVILDIDAFRSIDLKPGDDSLWQTLESLRALKNRCFFGTITEKTAELYV